MTKAIVFLFVVSFFGHLLFGCAHIAPVVAACKPAPADVDTALAGLQSDGWEAALEALATAKGICVARAAVQQVINALNGGQALQMLEGTPSSPEIVSRGKAWLTANP